MPKLLIVNVASNWGSHGRIVESIGLHCLNSGWEVKVAHGQFFNPSSLDTIRIGSRATVYCHYLRSLFDAHGRGSKRATREFIRQVKDYDPDIIHLNIIHDYYINYDILFRYLSICGKPVVWTFHDCWAFTGHCAHFENEHCYKWKRGCHNCINRQKYPRAIIDRSERNYRLKRTAFNSVGNMTIVACSRWISSFLPDSFFKNYPVETIYNGIELNDFRYTYDAEVYKKYGISRDKFVILGLASRWDKMKGLYDILELDDILEHRLYQIVLVGLKKSQLTLLPSTVIGIERTDSKAELAALYSVAGAFVNPTYEDTLPTTNIEALACGTPVVTYRTGGCPETIDADTGYVVPRGDIISMHRCIQQIHANGKAYYQQKCSTRARSLFSTELCCSNYEDLYLRLLNV